MKTVSLDAFSVEVRKKRDNKTLNLSAFNGRNSFLVEIHNYLKAISGKFYDSTIDRKCIAVDRIINNSDGLIGVSLIGEYGYGGRLVNAQSGTTTYNRKKSDAPIEPFFFEIYAKTNSKKGILLCAKHGQSGCKVMIDRYISQMFETNYPDYTIDIKPLMPKQAIDALVKRGKLNAVRFVQNIIPSDIADRFNGNRQTQEGEVEIVIRPKKNGFLNMGNIFQVYDKTKNLSDIISVQNFSPDNMKLEIEIDGRKRVVDFGNLGRVRSSFDITSDIENDNDGYPTFDSMKNSSEELIKTLAKSL